jgi:hypothetical protein
MQVVTVPPPQWNPEELAFKITRFSGAPLILFMWKANFCDFHD